MEKNIALITSRYWEGGYVCKLLSESRFNLDVFVQKTWWKDKNNFSYTKKYLEKIKESPERYFVIEDLTKNVQYIDNVNSRESINKLNKKFYDGITVVGSRILKEDFINNFEGRIINYHTGLLPQYRGPYSEFWAINNNESNMIGTTIHLIDKGIDTGAILKRESVKKDYKNPINAHIDNSLQGANLLLGTLEDYFYKNLKPTEQDKSVAKYYPFPTEQQICSLEKKIGEKINLYFAD